MKNINALDELGLPNKQTMFLKQFLKSVCSLKNVKMVILFGSAAKGKFRAESSYNSDGSIRFKSDLDLMVVGDNITEEDELVIFGDYGIPIDLWVKNDVMTRKEQDMIDGLNYPGCLEWRIAQDGINLSNFILNSGSDIKL